MPSSRGSSRHRDQTGVSESPALAGRFFTAEPSGKPLRTLCLCKLLRILLSTVSITNSYIYAFGFIYPSLPNSRLITPQISTCRAWIVPFFLSSLGSCYCWTSFVPVCIQFSSVAQSCLTLWDPMISARQASLSITNSQSLLKLMPMELVMPSSHFTLCHPLLLLPPIPPSIRVFSNESALRMRWPKYWSFSFSINPSNEHPGLISFRMDWLDLLEVQGTLKSLLQHYSSKASIFRRSAFFTVQLSHPYMTTGETIALTRRTSIGKVMSLLFNMLSRLVITFLPRSKCLLISSCNHYLQ